ncbi:MAG: hypothetical protein IT367_21705 [Candidatus Hydrogenedentes bacterium]|nr:hypothetical protein [Candidatus Hydrogenedentota bacterium]
MSRTAGWRRLDIDEEPGVGHYDDQVDSMSRARLFPVLLGIGWVMYATSLV